MVNFLVHLFPQSIKSNRRCNSTLLFEQAHVHSVCNNNCKIARATARIIRCAVFLNFTGAQLDLKAYKSLENVRLECKKIQKMSFIAWHSVRYVMLHFSWSIAANASRVLSEKFWNVSCCCSGCLIINLAL